MVPMPGKYLPFAHIALGLLHEESNSRDCSWNMVGHVFYYLTTVVPFVTQGPNGVEDTSNLD